MSNITLIQKKSYTSSAIALSPTSGTPTVESWTGSTPVSEFGTLATSNDSFTPTVLDVASTPLETSETHNVSASFSDTVPKSIGAYITLFSSDSSGGTTVSPTTGSTYLLYPDFYGMANKDYFTSGATGVSGLFLVKHGLGYPSDVAVVIEASPLGNTATATATVNPDDGSIEDLTLNNYGSDYIFSPLVSFDCGATGPLEAALAYTDIINSNYQMPSFDRWNEKAGVILSVSSVANLFVQATAKANLLNNSIFSCDVLEKGKGYIYPPRIYIVGGGGSGAFANSILLNNQVNSIYMITLGTDYVSVPIIEIDPPGFVLGERVYQSATGARGRIDRFDSSNFLLYVFKDLYSPDFDNSPIVYSSTINISVDKIVGFYKTKGKRIDTLPEAEVSVIGTSD